MNEIGKLACVDTIKRPKVSHLRTIDLNNGKNCEVSLAPISLAIIAGGNKSGHRICDRGVAFAMKLRNALHYIGKIIETGR